VTEDNAQATITQARLKSVLRYDPETGEFTWIAKVSNLSRAKIGSRAGSDRAGPYRILKIDKKNYLEHRMVWLYVFGIFPQGDIDHKNLNKKDNRLSNLRLASDSQNRQNTGISKRNTSGVKGVTWCVQKRRWRAMIKLHDDKWQTHLGYFKNKDDAKAAYDNAAKIYFGEFARPNEVAA